MEYNFGFPTPPQVFIDEVDAIAPSRGGDSEEVTARIVAALLTVLDGGKNDLNPWIVIGATNRVDAIDQALRRPGRFDRELEIGLVRSAFFPRQHLKSIVGNSNGNVFKILPSGF